MLVAEAKPLLSPFEDSTHQVFVCDTEDGCLVLKVCNQDSVARSGFWQGLNDLFSADFPNSLGRIEEIHALLKQYGRYEVPQYVASNHHQFVLTRLIDGVGLAAPQVTDAMVEQLAQHIAQLHAQKQPQWGAVHAPRYHSTDWPVRLAATLQSLASHSEVSIPQPLLQSALLAADTLQETEFVPMMLDLRWDQFRVVDGTGQLALLDLDAFVVGPRALDLVLLEYVLTPLQFDVFKKTYMTQHDWPDYSADKPCYQLLLFLMQIMGETDLTKWMRR